MLESHNNKAIRLWKCNEIIVLDHVMRKKLKLAGPLLDTLRLSYRIQSMNTLEVTSFLTILGTKVTIADILNEESRYNESLKMPDIIHNILKSKACRYAVKFN